MSSIDADKSLVRAFVAALNAQDWLALDALVADGFVRHSGAGGDLRGRAELVAYMQAELATFPDVREEILDLVAEGDRIAVRHGFVGTQHGPLGAYPPSGRTLRAQHLAIYRIAGGRIAEAWAEWDSLGGLAQLGHVVRPGATAGDGHG